MFVGPTCSQPVFGMEKNCADLTCSDSALYRAEKTFPVTHPGIDWTSEETKERSSSCCDLNERPIALTPVQMKHFCWRISILSRSLTHKSKNCY
jgi:hypothetical protein